MFTYDFAAFGLTVPTLPGYTRLAVIWSSAFKVFVFDAVSVKLVEATPFESVTTTAITVLDPFLFEEPDKENVTREPWETSPNWSSTVAEIFVVVPNAVVILVVPVLDCAFGDNVNLLDTGNGVA